ncbi:hypothetical protein D3C81_1291370 [compost metagenome]
MPGIETRVQLFENVAVLRIQQHLLDDHLRLPPDYLLRARQALPDHAGAQNVVTGDDLLQVLGEAVQTFKTVEGQTRLQQVRIALFGTEVVIKNAFLQRCQRIDILHIRSTARHRRDDTIDAGLIECGQGQHVGRDVCAIGRNQICRHIDFPATAQGPRQRGQARLVEQHAHIGA